MKSRAWVEDFPKAQEVRGNCDRGRHGEGLGEKLMHVQACGGSDYTTFLLPVESRWLAIQQWKQRPARRPVPNSGQK